MFEEKWRLQREEWSIQDARRDRVWHAKYIQQYLKNNYFIHWHPNGEVYYYSKDDKDIDWFEKNFPIEIDENGNYIKEEFSMPDGLEKVPLVELKAIINRECEKYTFAVFPSYEEVVNNYIKQRELNAKLADIKSQQTIDQLKADKLRNELNPQKDASVVGRAVAGGVIAGPTGAIVGAASAIDKNMKKNS